MIDNRGFGYIDVEGNFKIELLYAECQPFINEKAPIFYEADANSEVIDYDGRIYVKTRLLVSY